MALDDRYKVFQPHQDNVQEIISATDVNAIQAQVQASEQDVFEVRDIEFLNRCLFILENHSVLNALWIDNLTTTDHINMSSFRGLAYNQIEASISLATDLVTVDATLTSLAYTPATGSITQNVVLMVEDFKPANTSISYSISNDNGVSWTPIIPNQSLPITLPATGSQIQLRARMQRTAATGDSPALYAWAILYDDAIYRPYIPDSMPGSTPFATITHASLLGVLPDQHHPMVHMHDGIDGSGQVYHRSLLGMGPDDHHPKFISTAVCLVRMIGSIFRAKSKIRSPFNISRLCSLLVCRARHLFTETAVGM